MCCSSNIKSKKVSRKFLIKFHLEKLQRKNENDSSNFALYFLFHIIPEVTKIFNPPPFYASCSKLFGLFYTDKRVDLHFSVRPTINRKKQTAYKLEQRVLHICNKKINIWVLPLSQSLQDN